MFYRLAQATCRLVLFLLRWWKVYGKENIPASGGLVVVSNHVSYWDPVAVGCALNRKIYFMAKAELFRIPLLGSIISRLGAFPLHRRGSDRRAMRQALQLLKDGQLVGIFPEGTRSHTGELLDPHLGAAMLILRSGVPALPVAVIGSRGVFGRIRVNIGRPIEFSEYKGRKTSREDYRAVSLYLMKEIGRLLDQQGKKR